jgi:hypothetical protein
MFETVPKHISDAPDPHTKSLTLLEFAGNEEVLGHRLDHVPRVETMFDGRQSSVKAERVDVLHEGFDWATSVGSTDSQVDVLLV